MNDGWMSESAEADKTLYKGDWLSVKQTPGGYDYMHQEKSNGGAVAVLAYKLRPARIVGRYEECPPHRDGLALCAITGMMDHDGEDPATTAARELQEEAGIVAGPDELNYLGAVRTSKASDTTMHLFSIDIGENRDIGKSVGDGTRGEANAYCEWITVEDALKCKDPLVAAMMARTFGVDVVRG
jgi:8-oxo-dGTP pyrophosphatase MutT (NUDIX family)